MFVLVILLVFLENFCFLLVIYESFLLKNLNIYFHHDHQILQNNVLEAILYFFHYLVFLNLFLFEFYLHCNFLLFLHMCYNYMKMWELILKIYLIEMNWIFSFLFFFLEDLILFLKNNFSFFHININL